MIGERNVIEEALVVVAIEGSPAAVAILHAEQPLDAAANGGFHALGIGKLYALESHQDERGVVHVGIKVVAEFEDPTAGSGVFVFDLPVAGAENLLRQNPVGGFHERRVIGGHAGFFERDHRDAGVPHGRDARLKADRVFLFDFEPCEFANFARGQRIVGTMAERHQRENRIHHRRINRGEAFGALDVLEHPGFRFTQRAIAQRLPRQLFVELHRAIGGEEEIAPRDERFAPIERRRFVRRIDEEFINLSVLWQAEIGTQRGENRHRDDDAARPRRHLVDVEIEPIRQQHHFRQDRGNHLPAERTGEREIEANVGICFFETAEAQRRFARLDHMRRILDCLRRV